MDQTAVRSGYDLEFCLSERYLQYLVLLALDVGIIPVTRTFTSPPAVDGLRLTLQVPDVIDRTYALNQSATLPELTSDPKACGVKVVMADPAGADVVVGLRVHVELPSRNLDFPGGELFLHLRLALDTEHDAGTSELTRAAVGLELVDISGLLVDAALALGVAKSPIFDPLAEAVNRSVDLGGLSDGKRVQDVALRKFPASGGAPAGLGVYLNLRLKTGPDPGQVLPARGDIGLARNLLFGDRDLVFATRSNIYGDLGTDAYARKAVWTGTSYDHPLLLKGERQGALDSITVRPRIAGGPGVNVLEIVIKGDYTISYFPDPGWELTTWLRLDTDADGIAHIAASGDLSSGLLADLILGLLAGASAFLLGPYAVFVFAGLEVAKGTTLAIISKVAVDDRVENRVDAAFTDISPTRLTVVRRRWDPFITTRHQLGLRDAEMLVNDLGLAIHGRVALARAQSERPVNSVLIYDAVRDTSDLPAVLRYWVLDAAAHRPHFTATAPATTRGTWTSSDPAQPDIFDVAVSEATRRVAEDTLQGRVKYTVKRIETKGHQIAHLLVVSNDEIAWHQGNLEATRIAAARAALIPQEPDIRAQVIAALTAQGIIPTPERVDAEVARQLQERVDADLAAYRASTLGDDLDAVVDPLLRFSLTQEGFGSLQDGNILIIDRFSLIHRQDGTRYYRDRYDPRTERTPAERQADNLRSKPRYRSTPGGGIELL